ncbi:MAG: EamA family transporter [Candidatus Riflebacteria bacterium]|nr:EamA family transporter [Candidatus Riflebacteria bacterium]
MAVFNIIGAFSTLGLYGILWGRAPGGSSGEWARAFVPMAVMAAGDLGVIIATQTGKVGIVTPISGAYPVVTLVFARLVLHERITRIQMACVAATLAGMFLSIPELTDLIGWFRELMHR